MAGRKWTDEERKSFGERMKQKRAQVAEKLLAEAKAKRAEEVPVAPPVEESLEDSKQEVPAEVPQAPESAPDESTDEATDEETTTVVSGKEGDRIARLEAQIELLIKMNGANAGQPSPNASAKTVDKFSTDLSIYDSPVPKLMEWGNTDRRMQQQGFSVNYELQFVPQVPPRYQLADKTWERQPKFTLGLLEKAYDDDGNELTRINERGEKVQIKYLRKRLIFFEDPDNALAIAHRKGIQLDDETSQSFLNDMRYIQAQEWLLEVFYPPKANQQAQMREEAIGGQMVTIVESPAQFNKIDPSHSLKV